MSSPPLLYTALAAGVLGLMAGLKGASDETKQRVLEEASPAQQEMAEECIACAEFMKTHGNEIPRELQNHPSIAACEKIKTLPPKKMEKLLRKFLQSDRINRDKLRELTKMCNGADAASCVATQIHGQDSSPHEASESASSVHSSEKASETTSSTHSSEKASETTSSPPTSLVMSAPSEEEWIDVQFDWNSDDEVESGVTGYSM